jgi:PAS domain S-box-containing protein
VVHPDERDHVDAAVSLALNKLSPYSVDFRVADSDGVTHWIHSRGHVVHDMEGRPVRMIGVATDITARKQADEALWEALELETVILRSVPVVTYVTDASDQLVTRWISDNVQTVSGYPPQRFLSEQGFWIDRIHPDDRGRVLDTMQDLHHKKTCKSEYRWLHHDGSYHWFFDHLSVKPDAQGTPQAFIGVWLDVTDRKQAEETLHRVLEERERLSQELHDGVIQTLYALGLMLEESQRLIVEDAGKALSLLDRTVATINLTISSLRRYIHGREPAIMSPALFKSEMNSLVALIEAFDARVNLQLSDHGIDQLTPGQIEHVFFIVKEALSNAARHSNGTEILVSIALRTGGVRVAILDNGSGFNVETVHLGQGLRNMQSRAQKMGAQFSLISAPKKGTLIVIKIPKEAQDGRVAR